MNAHSSLRIFVVENHLDSLRALRLYLEQSGYTVLSATTLQEALAALPAAECDVLISDIGLPDGSGWELIERVELPKPVFAIAMSGYGMMKDREKSKAVGFHHHMVKPPDPDELDAVLERAAAEIAGWRAG